MSVLIKNIKMPKSCIECRFYQWYYGKGQICDLSDSVSFKPSVDKELDVKFVRTGDCPLMELPPHGRLIDADEFWRIISVAKRLGTGAIQYYLDSMPTIIESEEAENG